MTKGSVKTAVKVPAAKCADVKEYVLKDACMIETVEKKKRSRRPKRKPKNAEEKIPQSPSGLHYLNDRWTLWYLKGDRNKDWEQCLHQVYTVDSIEGFWALYKQIQTPLSLNWGSDYYFFREHIKPKWEDKMNVNGGRWLLQVDKYLRAVKLDAYWLDALMSACGEQFEEHSERVCGVVLNVRQKGDKVSVWTTDANNDVANLHIGTRLKKISDVPDNEVMRYEIHKDIAARTGSVVKPRHTLPSRDNHETPVESK